jgi:tRNA A-37 threonylcarbamoyl transferase component Bud32
MLVSMASSDTLEAGTTIAGYRVTHRVGAGGMGAVYAAEEPRIGKRVAIKILKRDLAADPDMVARFEREAKVANEVRHPGIVDVLAFGALDDGRPYLVMSLLEGRHLGEEIAERGRLPPREAWRIARQIADALAAAHDRGVVHRDLKPENVFLERCGDDTTRVRLLDLGLVKLLETHDASEPDAPPMKLTRTGVPMGTPLYMAPEQWWGGAIDARADQYALGVTLYEMLSGHPPFQSEQFVELAQKHLHDDPPPLEAAGCVVAPPIEALVRRALAKAPEERFESMRDLIDAGDRVFGPADALAPTAIAEAPAVTDPALALRPRYLALALVGLFGPMLLVAIGYAGAGAHDVVDIVKSTGPPFFFVFGGWIAGIALTAWATKRRALTGKRSILPLSAALLTAAFGMLGTHVGWSKVRDGVAKMRAPVRFEVMHTGMLELLLSRYLGFYLAALTLLGIAFTRGVDDRLRSPDAAPPERDRIAITATTALVAIAVATLAVDLRSAALVALVAAVASATPLVDRRSAPTPERTAAILLAVLFTFVAAMARIEGREAALWQEQPTRAARAAEVIAARTESGWSLAIGAACIAIVTAAELVRLARANRGTRRLKPTVAGVAIALAAIALGAGDLALRMQFNSATEALHRELDAQFSLFANLEPPAAGGLDPATHAARPAPALQVARTVVAVDNSPVAPIAAVRFSEGESNVGRAISHALAVRAAAGTTDGALAVSIDREVPWSTAASLLAVAHRAGAQNLQLLLTRGPALELPEGAPAEASWVLASDFVALPIVISDDGLRSSSEAPYAAVAEELIRRAESGEDPVRVATTAP